jgi:1-acyl-sn-glycerol-3-phosphate acyltransferase
MPCPASRQIDASHGIRVPLVRFAAGSRVALIARIQRTIVTLYIWHVVLNCAFASFVCGMPLALLVPRRLDPGRRLPHRVGTFWWGRMVWALNPFVKLEIEGRERLEGGPYLVCTNHQSLLDVLVVMALGGDFKWVSGLRFFKIPMLAVYMKITGYIAADLKNPFGAGAVLDECGEWLDKGVSVGLFPEGTRSADGRLGPFKAGAFRVATTKGVPVLPVAIEGTRWLLPKHGWSYQEPTPFRTIRVKVLDPIHERDLSEPGPVALSRAVKASIGRTLSVWRGEAASAAEPVQAKLEA